MKIIAVIMKKTQKILSFARFSDRMEVTKINQAKRKSRSLPSPSAILEPGTGEDAWQAKKI